MITIGLQATGIAAPPQLYSQSLYQSPVSGNPDDLLLLAGYGFAAGDVVVYRELQDRDWPPAVPGGVPTDTTVSHGIAPIVGAADAPYALTVRLPAAMRANQPYVLWVHTAQGEWSQPLLINDARPVWFSPAFTYASHAPAGLPRELKIVGRNLQPTGGQITRVRLVGPRQYMASAVGEPQVGMLLAHYVARVPLPAMLMPGSYRVQVSRDGIAWVDIAGQRLEVRPDDGDRGTFNVGDPRFGDCHPDDGRDDTDCIMRAIDAANSAGGGTVDFGPGIWSLAGGNETAVMRNRGILVPPGVSLRGAGSEVTRLVRTSDWTERAAAAFVLTRDTQVSGFTFQDQQVFGPRDVAGPYLQLGEDFRSLAGADASRRVAEVLDVVITHNVFDRTFVAVGSGGLPISHLFITHNVFGAYSEDLALAGNRFNLQYRYGIADAVIDGNVFKPGSRLDSAGKTGVIASELGAALRVDFSGNVADGRSTDFLYAAGDPKGWRAAYFWNLNDNVEELLVSQNTATCTGDKIGDGEAIAFDNNGNTFAFGDLATVTAATADTVAVGVPLAQAQSGQRVPLATYYDGHWVQVAGGPGVGQARRIVGYVTDPVTNRTVIRIAPSWDVIPVPGQTRIAAGREFWQTYVLDNRVDNRMPPCRKSNRSRQAAGAIAMWAQSADSVIAGNQQYDSDGILVQQNIVLPQHPCRDCTMDSYLQSFLDIRSNLIDGEYDWDVDCSSSGITIGVAAAPWGAAPPATVGFGVNVAYNEVRHADSLSGGAISQASTWYAGPPPERWPMSDNLLIQHNVITDLQGAAAMAVCRKVRAARTGIAFPDSAVAWRTVLYANSCHDVAVSVGNGAVDAVKVCPASGSSSCECPAAGK